MRHLSYFWTQVCVCVLCICWCQCQCPIVQCSFITSCRQPHTPCVWRRWWWRKGGGGGGRGWREGTAWKGIWCEGDWGERDRRRGLLAVCVCVCVCVCVVRHVHTIFLVYTGHHMTFSERSRGPCTYIILTSTNQHRVHHRICLRSLPVPPVAILLLLIYNILHTSKTTFCAVLIPLLPFIDAN